MRCCESGPSGWVASISFPRFVPFPEIRTVTLVGGVGLVLQGDWSVIVFGCWMFE